MRAKIKFLAKFGIGAAMMLLLFGCEEGWQDSETYESGMTDEQALEELFLEDADVESPDIWQDGSAGMSAAELRGLDEEIDPLGWWRIGHREREHIYVDFIDDDHAVITRVRSFDGTFRLLTDVSGESMETIDKPMYNDLVRKARAVRVDNSHYPRRNWRLTSITPEVMSSVEPNPNSVNILNVTAVCECGNILADISHPLETYFNRENLPEVIEGEAVTVYVEVEGNVPAPIGALRPDVYRDGRRPRLPLFDDGIAPDEVAGDGVYTGSYAAGHRLGLHHIGLDFIDDQTIYDDEAEYDASGWAVPYAVVRD